MSSRWLWGVRQLSRRLWLRAALIGVLGIVAALIAIIIGPIIPETLTVRIGADSVGSILNVLASSMLAVTTFSLSVMTSAYSAASNGATPRATQLLIEDTTGLNALSTFLGSFLFSIVGLIVLKVGGYADGGRFLLFLVTIGVVGLIVISLVRWIDHLTRLGRVGETTTEVEEAAHRAIMFRLRNPYLGGQRLGNPQTDIPAEAVPLVANEIGYIQHIDAGLLSSLADRYDADIYLTINPGAFAYPRTILAWILTSSPDVAIPESSLLRAFSFSTERTFDQDPRFCMIVLSEIASRALSAAINDPGTAIDVANRTIKLLSLWAQGPELQEDVKYPKLYVSPLRMMDILEDCVAPFVRYGAASVEVQVRLQKGLHALSRIGDDEFRTAVKHYIQLCVGQVKAAPLSEADFLRVKRASEGRDLSLSTQVEATPNEP